MTEDSVVAEPGAAVSALRQRFEATPIYECLGVELDSLEKGNVRLSLNCGALHANLDGWLHGGLIEFMADTAMGFAARLERPDIARNRTLQFNLVFQEGSAVDDRVECVAEVTYRTRNYTWTRCVVSRTSDGSHVAEATALQLAR